MEDGTVMLVVNQPRLIDSGRYIMFVRNRVGNVELTYILDYEQVVPAKVEEERLFKKKKHWDEIVVENEVHPRKFRSKWIRGF